MEREKTRGPDASGGGGGRLVGGGDGEEREREDECWGAKYLEAIN